MNLHYSTDYHLSPQVIPQVPWSATGLCEAHSVLLPAHSSTECSPLCYPCLLPVLVPTFLWSFHSLPTARWVACCRIGVFVVTWPKQPRGRVTAVIVEKLSALWRLVQSLAIAAKLCLVVAKYLPFWIPILEVAWLKQRVSFKVVPLLESVWIVTLIVLIANQPRLTATRFEVWLQTLPYLWKVSLTVGSAR